MSHAQVDEELTVDVALVLADWNVLAARPSVTPISRQHSEVPSGLSARTRGSGYSACVNCGFAIVGTGIDQRANGPLFSMSC